MHTIPVRPLPHCGTPFFRRPITTPASPIASTHLEAVLEPVQGHILGAAAAVAAENVLQQTLEEAVAGSGLDPASSTNGMVFLLITGLGLLMAVVYVPIRLFLTITARSRRLRVLQKIRRLRDNLRQPADAEPPVAPTGAWFGASPFPQPPAAPER